MLTRRTLLGGAASLAGFHFLRNTPRDFEAEAFGAAGDGKSPDTLPVQRAIDAAAAWGGGGRVLLRGGRRYLCGALRLKSRMEFCLADGATLVASTDPGEYEHAGDPAVLSADGAQGLKISGGGYIDGQAIRFMTGYSEEDQRWTPGPFRPGIFLLRRCRDLEVSHLSFGSAPFWGLHMLGCDGVLVEGVDILNLMDVPNCDGIDPDHCRNVEIRKCDITSADDSICIKTTRQPFDYGGSRNIVVRDCRLTTRDSGLKVGTETYGDISKILFEHCRVISGGRGPTITLRDAGNLSDIEFNDIEVCAEHHAAEWWGWGEAVSVTVRPRSSSASVGTLRDVRLRNVRGRAENSARIDGMPGNPIQNVLLENLSICIDKWTNYPGGKFDNRPAEPGTAPFEEHTTPVFSLRNADHVLLKNCKAEWGANRQAYFGSAVEAEDVHDLRVEGFKGEAAYPERDPAINIR